MRYQKFFKFTLFSLLLSAFLVGCDREEPEEMMADQSANYLRASSSSSMGGRADSVACFDFVFPILVQWPDGTTDTINSLPDLETLKDQLEDMDLDEIDLPSIIFPIQITLGDGTVKTLNSEEELMDLFYMCYGDKDDDHDCDDKDEDDCFEYLFPISFDLSDGTVQTVNNAGELETLEDAWEAAGIEDEIIFPVDVKLKDGTIKSVTDEAELDALEDACEDEDDEDDD